MSNNTQNRGYKSPQINENHVQLTGTAIHLFHVPGTETVVLTVATSGGGARSNYPKSHGMENWQRKWKKRYRLVTEYPSLPRYRPSDLNGTEKKLIYRQNIVGRGNYPGNEED